MDNLINISYLYYNKSLDFIEKNNISAAKENLEKAIKVYSKDIDMLNLMGLCEYYFCDFNRANFYWKKSLEISEVDNIAHKYIEEKLKTDEFDRIIEKYNIGLDYFNDGKYEESIKIFKNILEYENKFIEVYEILIISYLKINDIKNARKNIDKLEALDIGNNKIVFYEEEINKIEIKAIKKDLSKSTQSKIDTVSIKENNCNQNKKVVFTFVMVAVLIGLNLFVYSKYSKKESENINNIKYELEQKKIAYDELEKENKKLNNDIKAIFNNNYYEMVELQKKTEKYYINKEYKKVIENFNYILDYSDDEYIKADAVYFIAASNLKLGKKEEAMKYYEMYINEYPNGDASDDVLYNYALILNDINNREKAKEIAKQLKENYPDSQFNNSKIASIIEK